MKKLPTINFKGKEYTLISERVLYFNETYPNGAIVTKKLETNGERVEFMAVIIPDVKNPERKFTGHSQAVWGDGYINKTSALENAETSAVGRALAMMGIGVTESIASIDEIKKASQLVENARNGVPSSIVDYQEITEAMPHIAGEINNAKKEYNRSTYTGLATTKQKDLIMSLCLEKGVKTTTEELGRMTSGEASKKIKSLQALPNKSKSKGRESSELDFAEELDEERINPEDVPF